MNAVARAVFPSVRDDEWQWLGYMDTSMPHTSTLTNEIHPLLQFSNDQRGEGRERVWTLLEGNVEEMEQMMLPVLRLATKIILSPASIQFIYYILYGPREELADLSRTHRTPVRAIHPTEDVRYDEMFQKVNKALTRLAVHTRFALVGAS